MSPASLTPIASTASTASAASAAGPVPPDPVEGSATDPSTPVDLGAEATRALLAEADLTPKPGLVDRRGRGAHTDMDLALLRRSAAALAPWFGAIERTARGRRVDRATSRDVVALGVRAERAMLWATGGVNTHRGALFSLGWLVAGAAVAETRDAGEVTEAAARLVAFHHPVTPTSHGTRARQLVPGSGAPHEARAGYPTVRHHGLPALRRARLAGDEATARLDALLALMVHTSDTCLIHRGGPGALRRVRAGAAAVLAAGGAATTAGRAELARLDRWMLAARLSPGGSADLLATTLLLDRLETR